MITLSTSREGVAEPTTLLKNKYVEENIVRHIVYRTVNTVNGKEYIGAHTELKPNDGYLGSGDILKEAIKKYGRGTFVREELSVFDNIEDMYAREMELVTPEYVARKDTYNIRLGGFGGRGVTPANKGKSLPAEQRAKISASLTGYKQTPEHVFKRTTNIHLGRKRSEETRRRQAEAQRGKTASAESRRRMSEKALQRAYVTCPHCGKSTTPQMAKRWHGAACRSSSASSDSDVVFPPQKR